MYNLSLYVILMNYYVVINFSYMIHLSYLKVYIRIDKNGFMRLRSLILIYVRYGIHLFL